METHRNLWIWDFCPIALVKLLGPVFPEDISVVEKTSYLFFTVHTPLWSTSFFCFNHIVRLCTVLVFKIRKGIVRCVAVCWLSSSDVSSMHKHPVSSVLPFLPFWVGPDTCLCFFFLIVVNHT